jgi:hypothetical protein
MKIEKYLLPYEYMKIDFIYYVRRPLIISKEYWNNTFYIFKKGCEEIYYSHNCFNGKEKIFESLNDAKIDLDNYLLNSDFFLISEKDVEKYKVLL